MKFNSFLYETESSLDEIINLFDKKIKKIYKNDYKKENELNKTSLTCKDDDESVKLLKIILLLNKIYFLNLKKRPKKNYCSSLIFYIYIILILLMLNI